MPWQDIQNVTDCAVYTLKHMETYKNQDPKSWKIGFSGPPNDVGYCFSTIFNFKT